MARGKREQVTAAPGYGVFSEVVFNPTTVNAIRYVEAFAGLSALGLRFPYNNGSIADTTISGGAVTTQFNRADAFTLQGTIDIQVSPCFFLARNITVEAGCIVDADGAGAPGGAGGVGVPAGEANNSGLTTWDASAGGKGDGGSETTTSPPQFGWGINVGGSGTSGVGAAGPFFSGRGGRGGRAAGPFPGAAGGDKSNSTPRPGTNGWVKHTIDSMDRLLGYALNEYVGGAGGGGGGGGGGQAGQDGNTGGAGGAGGGIVVFICEQWNCEGVVRARGANGENGVTGGGKNESGAGGGGSGGMVLVLTILSLADGTFQVTAGAGGTSSGVPAGNGASGVTQSFRVTA